LNEAQGRIAHVDEHRGGDLFGVLPDREPDGILLFGLLGLDLEEFWALRNLEPQEEADGE